MTKKHFNYECSIIVMNKNRIELLKNCLESIEKYTKDVNYELIIVDALSTDGSRDYLLTNWAHKASLIFEKDNTSYAASNNRVMKWSYGKYIYLLNNDCEVTVGWLRKAIDFAEKDNQVGHVASIVLWPDGTIMSHGANKLTNGDTIIPHGRKYPKECNCNGNYAYAGFGLYRRDLAEKINFLPEYDTFIYFDDDGYSFGVWSLGYDVRCCSSSVIIHKLYHSDREHHKDADKLGRAGFMAEWGDFLKENNGFCPNYPFTGKRPYKNGQKEKMTTIKKEEKVEIQENQKIQNIQIQNFLKTKLIFSNVEFIDGGGSKRPANLARAFLKQGYKVTFVNIYPSVESKRFKYEEVDCNLKGKNIEFIDIKQFNIDKFFQENNCDFIINELPHPLMLPILQEIRQKKPDVKIITEIIDNWVSSLGKSWFDPEVERKIFAFSDKITVTAKSLINIISQRVDKEIIYSPNAVNADIFDYKKQYTRPVDLPQGKPIVFYMGALWGNWIDFSLLEKCLQTYPDYNFVFVGDGIGERKKVFSKYKNCFLLGLKPVLEMPAYIAYSDLCIIPFKFQDDTGIVDTVSPLKLFEYVAMKKPVLATKYNEIENIPGCILADSKENFISLIPSLIKNKIDEKKLKIFLKSNTWDFRINQLIHLKKEALISIVLPTYNHARFLKESIDSVLNQTYNNLELIIVDDGSTDNTQEILQDYLRRPGVTIITHEKNKNLPNALNTGFKQARGEFLTWTSSDNIMLPNQLETLIQYFQDNSDKDMVYSNYQLIDENSVPVYNGKCRKHNRSTKNSSITALPDKITKENFYLSKDNFIGASFLYKRKVAWKIGEYDINSFGAEDYDYWLRVAQEFNIGHCPECLYKYRIHQDTLNSKAQKLRIPDNVTYVLNKHKNFQTYSVKQMELYNKKIQNSDKIKIIFQVEKMIPGGLEKVVYSLIKSINKTIFLPIVFIEDGSLGYYGSQLVKEDFQVFCLDKSTDKLSHLLDDFNPQIVSLHFSFWGIDEYKKRKIKVVYTIHNNYVWHNDSTVNYRRLVYRDYMNKFIAVSQCVKNYFIKYYNVNGDKVSIIPNGLLMENNTYNNQNNQKIENLQSFLNIKNDDFVFINPASFTNIKCQLLIIETIKYMKSLQNSKNNQNKNISNIKCLLIGGSTLNNDYYNKCISKIKEYNLEDIIKIITNAMPDDMQQFYKLSHCFLLPSITEGWSMSALEAINMELPLIMSLVGSAKEIIIDNGIIIPNVLDINQINGNNLTQVYSLINKNIVSLKEAMEKIIYMYDFYKNNAIRQKNILLNKYSMDNQIKLYEQEFKQLHNTKI